jgi:hypothetical protein
MHQRCSIGLAAGRVIPVTQCWMVLGGIPAESPSAKRALHLVVLTRLRYDPATRAYAQRHRAQGKTNREIRRCLVRYVARQLYRLLEATPAL